MYIGHLGVGLVAQSRRPTVPLRDVLIACVATDLLLFPFFHTVPGVALTAGACFYLGVRRVDRAAGVLLAGMVVAHIAVDLLTSGIVLWPNGAEVGLRLYDTPLADFALELPVIVLGWVLWRRTLLLPTARRAAASLLGTLLAFQIVFDVVIAGRVNG